MRTATASLATSGRNFVKQALLACLGLVKNGRVLVEDVWSSISDSVHLRIHNVPQNFQVDLSCDPQDLEEKAGKNDVPIVGHDLKANEKGR